MSAKDTLRDKKATLQSILSADQQLILNKVHERNLITAREYKVMRNIYKGSSDSRTIEIVDIVLQRGEAACVDFLDLLENDEMIKETFPDLQGALSMKYTVHPKSPREKTSSAGKRDDVTPGSDRQKQELKNRITNLCLAMKNKPTEGNVRHGSDLDAGHFFEGLGKSFSLKNPLGSKWIFGGVDDTIYKGRDAEVNGWGKFYLPKVVKMTVIGVIEGTSCPYEQLVLMVCEDGALYTYDGEELHVVALNVDQLLDKGIEYPAAKSYYKGEAFKDMTKEDWAEVRKGAVGKRLDEEHRKLVAAKKSSILGILKSTKRHKEASKTPTSALDQMEYYALTHNPRGWCVIINIENFTGPELKSRTGSQKDIMALTEVFSRLGFKVDVKNDFTADEIRTTLQNLGRENFLDHDALVVCVLSIGQEDVVYGSDERTVSVKELMQPFTSDKAPTLAGKPKLFFIEAYQEEALPRQEEFNVPHPETMTQVTVDKEDKRQSGLEEDTRAHGSWARVQTVPSDADFLMSIAAMPGSKSFRNVETGSIYTQELCRQLMRSAGSSEVDDIISVLTRVNREISKVKPMGQQMQQPSFTLTKKLFLNCV